MQDNLDTEKESVLSKKETSLDESSESHPHPVMKKHMHDYW